MAVTGYRYLYDYDFGPNYLRNVGIMNIGSVDPNFTGVDISGPGNAQPTGSGTIWYTQAGFYYPIKKQNRRLEFNPWSSYL
jgi:hypothetical protein